MNGKLSGRLEKLEAKSWSEQRSWSLVIQDVGETREQAFARWHAEHPGETPSPAGVAVVQLVGSA